MRTYLKLNFGNREIPKCLQLSCKRREISKMEKAEAFSLELSVIKVNLYFLFAFLALSYSRIYLFLVLIEIIPYLSPSLIFIPSYSYYLDFKQTVSKHLFSPIPISQSFTRYPTAANGLLKNRKIRRIVDDVCLKNIGRRKAVSYESQAEFFDDVYILGTLGSQRLAQCAYNVNSFQARGELLYSAGLSRS